MGIRSFIFRLIFFHLLGCEIFAGARATTAPLQEQEQAPLRLSICNFTTNCFTNNNDAITGSAMDSNNSHAEDGSVLRFQCRLLDHIRGCVPSTLVYSLYLLDFSFA